MKKGFKKFVPNFVKGSSKATKLPTVKVKHKKVIHT